jgi:hypothetical protein
MAAVVPLSAQAGELLNAKFLSDNTFTPAFKSLPGDAAKPLFVVSGGSPQVQDGKLVLANGRITVGAVADASGNIPQSSANSRPEGVLDLSKPYKIIVKLAEASSVASGKDNFFIYVNNSTTKQADSPLGSASQVLKVPVTSLKTGENVFSGTVGDAKSFIQLRAESGAVVKIESITVAAE